MTSRQLSRRTYAVVAIVATALALALGWLATSGARSSDPGDTERYLSMHGLQKAFTVKKYAKLADLVVVATPVSDEVHPFTENEAIPEWARNDENYATAGYHDVTLEVSEYVKGRGPDTVSVRRLEPPPGTVFDSSAPVPVLGQPQVFFLQEGDGVWTGGYLVLGEEALASVEGDVVKFKSGKEMKLDDFRKEVKEAEKEREDAP
jgi:uncharacterized protein YndB with AHSA1/START domain